MRALIISILIGIGCSFPAYGQDDVANADEPVFNDSQVARGEVGYRKNCATCHGGNLSDGQFGLPLRGSFFHQRWQDQTAGDLLTYTENTMPPAQPGYLSEGSLADIIVYILSQNGLSTSEEARVLDPAALDAVRLPWSAGDS